MAGGWTWILILHLSGAPWSFRYAWLVLPRRSFVVATLAAWRLARKRGPLPALLDALCSLPLVMPPTVLGYYLILLVGRRGVFGPGLAELGINLTFFVVGAVVAATVVAFPLIYKSARAALEQVDKHL